MKQGSNEVKREAADFNAECTERAEKKTRRKEESGLSDEKYSGAAEGVPSRHPERGMSPVLAVAGHEL
jgi:hypothetical protein